MAVSTIPKIVYECAFNVDANQSTLPPLWTDLTARAQFGWTTTRGRQYEQDVNETGELRISLANPDGALDPSNATSPYAPNVLPYRPFRIRANTAPTQNLLPQVIATGSASMNPVTDTVAAWWWASGGTLAQATNLAAAPSGQTTALAWTTPAATTSTSAVLWLGNWLGRAAAGPQPDNIQVTAGAAYTFSYYAMRTSSADATIQITPTINWYNAAGTALTPTAGAAVTVTVSPTWSARVTVSGTAPAGAVWARLSEAITSPASTTASNTLYHTGYQAEQAGAATAWADPGSTQFVFSGFVERWPQTWVELDGTYGQSDLVVVDAFAGLALSTLPSPFVAEILALGPNFFYQLGDPAGSVSCVDTAAKRVAAPVENSPFGAGALTFGNAVTSTTAGDAFTGAPGPVATFGNNSAAPAPPGQSPETFVSIHKTTVTPGPPTGAWTRMIAFRSAAAPGTGNSYTLWDAEPASWLTNASLVKFSLTNLGFAVIQLSDTTGAGAFAYTGATNLCDGDWHLLAIGNNPSGNLGVWVDGASVASVAGAGNVTGIVTDVLGCSTTSGKNLYSAGHIGDLAFAVEFPFLLTSAQVTNLYNSWRTASAGESSGSRYRRVLNWVAYPGATSIATGQTSSMGPATDLTGSTALDALNSIALTESGDQYVSSGGVLTFTPRTAYYNQRTPAYVFGEGAPVGAAGEWPCEISGFDYDPSRAANTIQIQQYQGPVYSASDQASAQRLFPRVYQRQINVTSGNEAQDAAKYLLGQYKTVRQRVETIRLHPSAVPGLFAVCLALEKGVRVRAIRRPNGAPAVTVDCFIQKVDWSWQAGTNDVWVDLQCSPADLTSYWVLAALHTTLAAQATSGTNTASINALPDAAVNRLAQSLPSGYQLTFEPGTARQETLTLAPGGIPATSLGYTSATLTFTTNFAFTHALGTTVCEPLPTGYTDPTTWDASSVLGAAYTTVLSGGASGTNTVTVGPLQDAAVNPLGSNWNEGDVIQLSPGTANVETATILSVATTYPGYTSCQLTLAANLTHSHAPGDYVCDPLPAGVTNPTALTPTTRLAY